MQKKICFLKKYIILLRAKKLKHVSSAVDLRYVPDNFGAEVLNNWNSAKNLLEKSRSEFHDI